jgi:hypothetical protein
MIETIATLITVFCGIFSMIITACTIRAPYSKTVARVVKLLFKCGPVLPSHVLLEGIEEFGAKTYELFIKNQKFI